MDRDIEMYVYMHNLFLALSSEFLKQDSREIERLSGSSSNECT